MDLITLESPFHAELPSGSSSSVSPASPVNYKDETFGQRFARAWKGLNKETRGWCESSVVATTEGLRVADLGGMVLADGNDFPREGKFESIPKILRQIGVSSEVAEEGLDILFIRDGSVPAAVKLRQGDDDSCLWILKCDDFDVKRAIREVLQNDP